MDLKTGHLKYKAQVKISFCRLSCAYRDGVYYGADDEGKFEGEGEAFVSKDTLLLFDLEFISRYADTKVRKALPKFYWLNGPPGCGKTYMIMKNFGPNVVVLTATSAGRDDVIETLVKNGINGAKERVKTVASAVMNPGKLPDAVTILVDEATMIHPGQIVFLVSKLATVSRVVLIGDINQIPFIDRLRKGDVQYHRAADVCLRLPDLTVTRRCPAQVVHALRMRYPGLQTSSTGTGVAKVINSLADLCKDPKALYMAYTQAEKGDLIDRLARLGMKPKVLTVAEAQGRRHGGLQVKPEQDPYLRRSLTSHDGVHKASFYTAILYVLL